MSLPGDDPSETERRGALLQARAYISGTRDDSGNKKRLLRNMDAALEHIAIRPGLLIEWRDAREEIFKTEKPTPDMFTRLGNAELALMVYARSLR